jgi:type IV secretion system protein VirD4
MADRLLESIHDFMRNERPVSLYLVVKPVDKDRLRPFVRLFITQVIRRLADEMKFKDGEMVKNYKHRLLLMLDEFPSLGRLQVFEEAIGFIAGYGLKSYLITQDISQLHKIYGRDDVISSNCHVQIAYATSKNTSILPDFVALFRCCGWRPTLGALLSLQCLLST